MHAWIDLPKLSPFSCFKDRPTWYLHSRRFLVIKNTFADFSYHYEHDEQTNKQVNCLGNSCVQKAKFEV